MGVGGSAAGGGRAAYVGDAAIGTLDTNSDTYEAQVLTFTLHSIHYYDNMRGSGGGARAASRHGRRALSTRTL